MNLTQNEKQQIGKSLIELQRRKEMNQAQFARSSGLTSADMSNIAHERWLQNSQLIGDSKWVKIAHIVGYTRNEGLRWQTAETSMKQFVDSQLSVCQNYHFSSILVDDAGTGKTYACKAFAAGHSHVYYVDCSNCRQRGRFARTLATAVGVDVNNASVDDLIEEVIYAIRLTGNPLIILDEAGDLADSAFLELKRLYNSLEGVCGFYLVGADGLRRRLDRNIAREKVGWTEIFSRMGKRTSKHVSGDQDTRRQIMADMAVRVITANGITSDSNVREVMKSVNRNGQMDLRTVSREVLKYKIREGAACQQ